MKRNLTGIITVFCTSSFTSVHTTTTHIPLNIENFPQCLQNLAMPPPDPNGGPCMLSHMHVTFVQTKNDATMLKNQLLVLFMWASPLLTALVKEKDDKHLNELAKYFDSLANNHWAVLFPKARRLVKEPSVAESTAFKKISTNLATLSCQVQSVETE